MLRRTTAEPYLVDVVDVRGVVVVSQVWVEAPTYHVGTSSLSTGMYLVRIRTTNASTAIPIIIE